MKTLDINEAASLLKLHPQTIIQRARSGEIPAAKPGKCWVFIEADLLDWLRSQYTQPRQDVRQGGATCSLKDKTVNTGGINLPTPMATQYANLLRLPINEKRRN